MWVIRIQLLLCSVVSLNIQNMCRWRLSHIVNESFAQKGTSGLVVYLVEKVNVQRCLPEPAAVLVVNTEHRHTHEAEMHGNLVKLKL